jgi:hypothetical protein
MGAGRLDDFLDASLVLSCGLDAPFGLKFSCGNRVEFVVA